MFDALHIAEEFRVVIHAGRVDLVKITGKVSDVITGCSKAHTKILREEIFREFADKVIYDDVYGNSEGSDIKRWQGRYVREVIRKYKKEI